MPGYQHTLADSLMDLFVTYKVFLDTIIHVNIFWAHDFVMLDGVVFGEIVCPVGLTTFPENFEILLMYAITYPVVSHVPLFGLFLAKIFCDKSFGSGVVSFDGVGSWGWFSASSD